MKTKGRPKGATSFVNVTMNDLKSRFGDAQAIPVSRIWLRDLGIEFAEPALQAVATQPSPASEQAIEMNLEA